MPVLFFKNPPFPLQSLLFFIGIIGSSEIRVHYTLKIAQTEHRILALRETKIVLCTFYTTLPTKFWCQLFHPTGAYLCSRLATPSLCQLVTFSSDTQPLCQLGIIRAQLHPDCFPNMHPLPGAKDAIALHHLGIPSADW